MRTLKGLFAFLAVAAVIVFAGQTVVYGGAGVVDDWAVNSGAQGEGGAGILTMYGHEVADTDKCEGADTEMRMYFFMRLKFGNEIVIFSGPSTETETVCHPDDFGEAEAVRLHEFLKDFLVERTGGEASPSPYHGCVADPFGDIAGLEDTVCPNILRSMKNEKDTNDQWGLADAPLSHISNVVIKIPR